MKKTTYINILKFILILSIVGIATSIYLVENHYASPTAGAICDFGETVSCSLVNTSVFSELFNVPVALFGALWFVILIFISWRAMKKDKIIPIILGWSIIGILFVIYMIISEIILKAICPFCTLVHIIVLIIFIKSIYLYKNQKSKLKPKQIFKIAKPWIIGAIIINIITVVYFNLPSAEKKNYDTLTKCMTQNDVYMYSSFRCAFCARTRDTFGSSFQYINEVECHPQGKDPETERCLKMDITKTPTWIIEKDGAEIKRLVGYQSPETLAEFAGCPIE